MSFDERIALELDALDQLGEVESPVAERQTVAYQRSQSGNSDKSNGDQGISFDRNETLQMEDVVDRLEPKVLDCDEVRIMIKVLGSKVCFNLIFNITRINL